MSINKGVDNNNNEIKNPVIVEKESKRPQVGKVKAKKAQREELMEHIYSNYVWLPGR